jgi:hypothetical protein
LKLIGNFIYKAWGTGKMQISGDSDRYELHFPVFAQYLMVREHCSYRAARRIKPKDSPLDENPAATKADSAHIEA